MEQSTAYFLGITPADWLNAVMSFVGMLLAILTAVIISPRITDRQNRRESQERLLKMLLTTRLIPANPDYQTAITMIPIEFAGNISIVAAYKSYLEIVNTKVAPENTEEFSSHNDTTNERQRALISVIAKSLGYHETTPEALKSDGYVSSGFVNREQMLFLAMHSWPRIADAIEQANSISLALWGEKLKVPVQDQPEPDKGA